MQMTNSNDNNINKDEKALEALLAATFHLNFPEEITDEQAKKLFQMPARLSIEDKKAIDSWGSDFIEKLIKSQKKVSDRFQQNIETVQELEQEYYTNAMNRDKDGNDLDEETRRKIDEERKKALEEENNKEDNPSNGF